MTLCTFIYTADIVEIVWDKGEETCILVLADPSEWCHFVQIASSQWTSEDEG